MTQPLKYKYLKCDILVFSKFAFEWSQLVYRYSQGDVIFRKGEVGDRFYIVETGNVAIHRRPSGAGAMKDEVLKAGLYKFNSVDPELESALS